MRVKWNEVFESNKGDISPKIIVQIEGAQMPPGANFGDEDSFCGIGHLVKHVGKDLDVEHNKDSSVVTINGIY